MSNFEEVLTAIQKLTPLEKIRLMEKLAASLEDEWQQPAAPRRSLYGIWSDVDISTDDIDDARRKMWGSFPREDI